MSTQLSIYSSYSLLKSSIRIPELVQRAKELGYSSIALTDHNVMHGIPSFDHEARKAGLMPIYGLEVDVQYHEQIVPFLLLAKNHKGYKNLMKLSSSACTAQRGVSLEEFIQYSPDNAVIAYGEGGWIESDLINEKSDEVQKKLLIMKEELPPFHVAISFQESSLWKRKNELLRRCARICGIPVAACHKVYYINPEDAAVCKALEGIRTDRAVDDKTLTLLKGRYLLSPSEMEQLYESEELQNAEDIARECCTDLQLQKTALPQYPVPDVLTQAQYLNQLCLAGLKKRCNGKVEKAYVDRLKYELDVIVRMHFENYFLIVYDFIRYARMQKIYVGPGRGSACGSLTAYCLGITQVDPLKYGLLFERFLNPERISMPDIDTDIPDNKRQEVIQYVYDKYGHDHVADIVAYGTFGARQALRDAGRYLNLTQRQIDMLCRMVPNGAGVTLQMAMDQNPKLRSVVNAEKKFVELMELAQKLEGLPRHLTTHAAGIIMSALPLSEVIPTMSISDGLATSQYAAEYLEERGLIKMDFLGLRNLSTIRQIEQKIQAYEPAFSILRVPLDDKKTFRIFKNADTTGIFQLESAGMKNLLRKLQCDRFEDVVAALALFRPASKDSIPLYIENKRKPVDEISYPVKELRCVLEDTYGVMIYQEQAMRTAQIVASFSLGRADVLRKAMSKKKESDLLALHEEFKRGALANGYSEEKEEELFELVSRFGGYGFNKSHAVAYAMVAYQMAYLKANHPGTFYSSLLNSVVGDAEKTSAYIDEARRKGILIKYPDIMSSGMTYRDQGREIQMPLCAVRNVNVSTASRIIELRNHRQFEDFADLVARLRASNIQRATIESLIDAGACDGFGYTRATLKASLDGALRFADLAIVNHDGQMSINFDLVSRPAMIEVSENENIRTELERAALGVTLGADPIVALRKQFLIHDMTLVQLKERGEGTSFARIQSVHTHRTKYGDMMAFLHLADDTLEMESAVMPDLFSKTQQILQKGTYIRFHGKINREQSCKLDFIEFVSGRKE